MSQDPGIEPKDHSSETAPRVDTIIEALCPFFEPHFRTRYQAALTAKLTLTEPRPVTREQAESRARFQLWQSDPDVTIKSLDTSTPEAAERSLREATAPVPAERVEAAIREQMEAAQQPYIPTPSHIDSAFMRIGTSLIFDWLQSIRLSAMQFDPTDLRVPVDGRMWPVRLNDRMASGRGWQKAIERVFHGTATVEEIDEIFRAVKREHAPDLPIPAPAMEFLRAWGVTVVSADVTAT